MTANEPEIELGADDLVEVPQVAASEHDMIMMARALISGAAAQDEIWALLCASRPAAPKIGTTCAGLLEDTLRHAWRALSMRGGARPGAVVINDPAGSGTARIARGRLWERHAPVPLAFTSATIHFLRWLVATPFAAPSSTHTILQAAPLAVGDQLVVYLALDAARLTPALRILAMQPFVRAAPLAWLGFANLMAKRGAAAPGFDSLTAGAGAIVVEALAGELAKKWHAVELGKRAMEDPNALIDLGDAQDQTLTGFLTSCDARHRRDLAGFVIDAAAPLLARNLAPTPRQLDSTTTLATRSQARIAAGSLLRAVARWSEWDQQHRGVRFIDDDYAAAQLLLERFEAIGAPGAARAAHWLAYLASLSPTATTSDTVPDP